MNFILPLILVSYFHRASCFYFPAKVRNSLGSAITTPSTSTHIISADDLLSRNNRASVALEARKSATGRSGGNKFSKRKRRSNISRGSTDSSVVDENNSDQQYTEVEATGAESSAETVADGAADISIGGDMESDYSVGIDTAKNGFSFDEDLLKRNLADSKLPPLAGSVAEKQATYNEKNVVQRYAEDLLAPTPVGEEPKLVKLAKTITWASVLILVLVEIVVSIKVGGMPFDMSKSTMGEGTTSSSNTDGTDATGTGTASESINIPGRTPLKMPEYGSLEQ